MELDDAVHTAILTLKEGFEGQMTETSLEIGIIGGANAGFGSALDISGQHVPQQRPIFRKLTPSEVRDYLANIA